MSHLQQWGYFLLFLGMCGIEGNLLPFTPSKWPMFRDNFGLATEDKIIDGKINPDGMQDAWQRFGVSGDYSHDGVNVAVEWGRLNEQRAMKFLCAIILDLLIALILVWIF